ncbi:MAG: glucose 1-dehydrogenase [Micromonosporaceae bacterium]
MAALTGKVAIVTGAGSARGQGAAVARLFAREGARVVVTDLPHTAGAEVAAELGEQGWFQELDVTDQRAWAEVVAATRRRWERIDILVNNAGVWLNKGLLDTTPEEYARVVAVNQTGVFLGMAAVAPVMRDQRSGVIINTCSVAGMKGGGQPYAYAASKWAVRGMTRAAAWELAPYGIRVNAISPGVVDTPMIEGGEPEVRRLATLVPSGRVAKPEEIATIALFLASDASSYVSGTEITADGALTA